MTEQLTEKVVEQLGYDELDDEAKQVLSDVTKGGADSGFGGFTYYNDTVEFFKANKTQIMAAVEGMADQLGEDTFTMIANFNCLKDQKLTPTQVAKAIYEETDDTTQVMNALSWFALEEVARSVTEQ